MFRDTSSEADVKDLFRKLSKLLHPDLGGNSYLFNKLIIAKNKQLELLSEPVKEREKYSEKDFEDCDYFRESRTSVDLSDEMPNELMTIIFSYSKEHKGFNPSFFNKMRDVYNEKGKISANQFNALIRTFRAFRMEEWYESFNE